MGALLRVNGSSRDGRTPPHARVERGERVVDDVRVGVGAIRQAREPNARALPAREGDAALAHLGLVAVRQARDVVVEACLSRKGEEG